MKPIKPLGTYKFDPDTLSVHSGDHYICVVSNEADGERIAGALNGSEELKAENEVLKGILAGDPNLTATKEEREHWRLSAVRYADKCDKWLGEIFRLTGADSDHNEDWRLAPRALEEVKRMRRESDEDAEAILALEAEIELLKYAERLGQNTKALRDSTARNKELFDALMELTQQLTQQFDEIDLHCYDKWKAALEKAKEILEKIK